MIATVIDQNDPQVIYDCYFMSESEFISVYGELYPLFSKIDLRKFWSDVRELSRPYEKALRKTRRPSSLKHLKTSDINEYNREVERWRGEENKAYEAMSEVGLMEAQYSKIYGDNDKGKRILEGISEMQVDNCERVDIEESNHYTTSIKKQAIKRAEKEGLGVVRFDGKYHVVSSSQKSLLVEKGAKDLV